jgi:hypothetical protein
MQCCQSCFFSSETLSTASSNPKTQVRNFNTTDDGYTIVELRSMGITSENSVLSPRTRVARQLPWPSGDVGAKLVTGRRIDRVPPLLNSIRNVTALRVSA